MVVKKSVWFRQMRRANQALLWVRATNASWSYVCYLDCWITPCYRRHFYPLEASLYLLFPLALELFFKGSVLGWGSFWNMGRDANLSCMYVQYVWTNSLCAALCCWDVTVHTGAVRRVLCKVTMQVRTALLSEQVVKLWWFAKWL